MGSSAARPLWRRILELNASGNGILKDRPEAAARFQARAGAITIGCGGLGVRGLVGIGYDAEIR
jgi:hypothetical protein